MLGVMYRITQSCYYTVILFNNLRIIIGIQIQLLRLL